MAVYGSCGQEELYQYGVLGMKWGIRHNPAKAYEKSSAKACLLYTSPSPRD